MVAQFQPGPPLNT